MATESCAEYRLRLRGNYRDKDMPRYDLNIAIFDYRAIATFVMKCSSQTRHSYHMTHTRYLFCLANRRLQLHFLKVVNFRFKFRL